MPVRRTPITENQYLLLNTTVDWKIDEVPREHWPLIPRLERREDTIAIMASGTISGPGVLNGIRNVVGAIDVLVAEPNLQPDEPEGNAYHYVFQKMADRRFPYLMYGPFKSDTVVDHWFDAPQLDRYFTEPAEDM